MFLTILIVGVGSMAGILIAFLRHVNSTPDLDGITPEWLEAVVSRSYAQRRQRGLYSTDGRPVRSSSSTLTVAEKNVQVREFRRSVIEMIHDFNRIHYTARILVANLHESQPALVSTLVRLKFRFTCSVAKAEWSYLLSLCNLRSLEVQELVSAMDAMTKQLTLISATHAAA